MQSFCFVYLVFIKKYTVKANDDHTPIYPLSILVAKGPMYVVKQAVMIHKITRIVVQINRAILLPPNN
jgi:hypothetical protein